MTRYILHDREDARTGLFRLYWIYFAYEKRTLILYLVAFYIISKSVQESGSKTNENAERIVISSFLVFIFSLSRLEVKKRMFKRCQM